MKTADRITIEKYIVAKLISEMAAAGWEVKQVWDGEESVKVSTEADVMEMVFAVDMSQILFQKGATTHAVQIVLGNSGYDCIADYGFSDKDDFEKVMDRVQDYANTFEPDPFQAEAPEMMAQEKPLDEMPASEDRSLGSAIRSFLG